MPPSQLTITPRLSCDDLVTWAHRGPGDRLVVCFSGIGKDAETCPPYEFARSATGNGRHNTLFIADPQRSWLNTPGLLSRIGAEIESYRAICGATRVIAMGHSMGGFSAIVASSVTRIDAVLAFAPQISIHPDIVPDETRWAAYRNRISHYEVKSAADHFRDGTDYTVIHGRHGREAPQRDRFPRRDTLRHYVMPGTHHNVPQRLKQLNCLEQVVHFAIEGRPRKLRLLLKQTAQAYLRPEEEQPV
ncbi:MULTISPECIES: hypothetical protein [unclassified Phaeobacter]|uniref:hypothetical protein n=1 Tax=unclassified Phaeobacter TaxID=2621772 RepID=UPI003A83BD4D